MDVVDVKPGDRDTWVVRYNGLPKTQRETKREAERQARLLAERRRAKLRIHRQDGSLQRVVEKHLRGWSY